MSNVFAPLALTLVSTIAREKSGIQNENSDYSCYSEDGYTDACSGMRGEQSKDILLQGLTVDDLDVPNINSLVSGWQEKLARCEMDQIC